MAKCYLLNQAERDTSFVQQICLCKRNVTCALSGNPLIMKYEIFMSLNRKIYVRIPTIFLTIISISDIVQAVRIRNSLIKHRGAYEVPN